MEKLIKKYLTPFEIESNPVSMQEKIAKHRAKKDEKYVNPAVKSTMVIIPKLSEEDRAKLAEAEKEKEDQAAKALLLENWKSFSFRIPSKFHKARLRPLEVGGEQSPNQRRILKEMSDKRLISNPRNALFTGTTGTGKTHFSVAMGIRYIYNGIAPKFAQDKELAKMGKDADRGDKAEWNIYLRCEILVIDDVAGDGDYGRIAPWESKYIRNLIEERCESGLVTIISTNFDIGQIQAYLGARVWSRFTADFTQGEKFEWIDFGDAVGLRGVA